MPTLRIHGTGRGTGSRRQGRSKSRRQCSSSRASKIADDSIPIEITYPGTNNYTNFTFDGLGNCVKIVETTSGSVTSTRQFVWCGDDRCEVRDASGNLLNQYFKMGQVNFSGGTGTSYYYTKDNPGSVREMTDASGNIQAQYAVDPYGHVTKLQGSLDSDFQYRGYYVHARSGLNFTATNVYNPALGRWMNRMQIQETKPANRYIFAADNPLAVAKNQVRKPVAMNRNFQDSPNGETTNTNNQR